LIIIILKKVNFLRFYVKILDFFGVLGQHFLVFYFDFSKNVNFWVLMSKLVNFFDFLVF